jgi:glucokinase
VIRLRDAFSKHVSEPVFVTNDANAAAIGEMLYGATKGIGDSIVVTLGTGVGSGFVSGGRLIYGHDGFAGELGHTIIEEDGRRCGCGRRGCLETYASATGFVRTSREMMKLGDADELSPEDVTEAAKRDDPTALAIFDFTAKKLAIGLANAVAITSPKRIVLFGGLARAGDLILAPTRRYLDRYLLNLYAGKVDLVTSGLADRNAAILGAAALAWQELG